MNKRILIIVVSLGAVVLCSYYLFFTGDKKSQLFTFGEITKGGVIQTIISTGTLQAVTTVDIGTQVSGKIAKLYADFNDNVKMGQLLAIIDTTSLITDVEDARSALEKAKANYDQARVTEEKNKVLYQKNFISELNYDTIQTNVSSAYSDMQTAQSALDRAITNLGYAYIYAPIGGTIQNRAVEEGQTVAASLAAPTLYTIAEDLNKMEILASIDESDIGQIHVGQKVDFSVQAYPDKKFWGSVVQIRINSAVVSNVVDYTVVVDADNKDRFLLPGMTATIDFYIKEKDSVLLIPNSALRFIPTDDMLNRYKDEMSQENGGKADTIKKGFGYGLPLASKPNSSQNLKPKFGRIWYLNNIGRLHMIPVSLGITDGKNTEIVKGKGITESMKIITGYADNSAVTAN